jgi:hypothetical protein
VNQTVGKHYTTLHYTTPHYTTLHYTTLRYTALHCTALHYNASRPKVKEPVSPDFMVLDPRKQWLDRDYTFKKVRK